MADFLRSWILDITVIIIFVMFLDMIMPNNSMKRYINVVVGLLIIIVVIKPFVLVKDYAESFNNEFLEASSFVEQGGDQGKSGEISKFQQQKAIEIFENNMKGQIVKLVKNSTKSEYKAVSVDLELERNIESEDFGNIKSIAVMLSDDRNEVIQVDRIKIGVDEGAVENKNVINKDKAEYNLNDSKISSEIKYGISKALGISESIVSVEVQQK
ncbi:MAG TPA: stage III sporulation protein AF [Patescibacteria group bacterium]|nr:stage III sporulation protein AF [Patescibacteria group bacterium]